MKTIKKALLISGGSLDEKFTLHVLKEYSYDYLIGVDKGNAFLYKHHISPTHIVGDFDSLEKEIVMFYKECTKIPIREFDPVKDASDTEIGLRLAMELGSDEIVILGATGTRIDHVLANIQMLYVAHEQGKDAVVLDKYNRIRLLGGKTTLVRAEAYGPYFSVFPLGGTVDDFSIRGAKYPLDHHCLVPFDSLCVSNQFKESEVVIEFSQGTVILMETKEETEK